MNDLEWLEEPIQTASRHFRDALYAQLARLGKVFASGPRLQLLDLLCQGPRTVEALALEVGQSLANTSNHLQVLRRARVVEPEKDGVHVIYRLADQRVGTLLRELRLLAEARLLEIEQVTRDFFAARDTMQALDAGALEERVRRGDVIVLDVRPREEYRAGHIPGAVSVPLAALERHLSQLPRDREVVAYCRGPYCVMALEAVEILRARGFKAQRMDEGVTDWRARGLPVAVSKAGGEA